MKRVLIGTYTQKHGLQKALYITIIVFHYELDKAYHVHNKRETIYTH